MLFGAIYCTQGRNIIYRDHAAMWTSCIFFIITNVAPEACHTAIGLVLDSPVAATLHLHDFAAAAQIKACPLVDQSCTLHLFNAWSPVHAKESGICEYAWLGDLVLGRLAVVFKTLLRPACSSCCGNPHKSSRGAGELRLKCCYSRPVFLPQEC